MTKYFPGHRAICGLFEGPSVFRNWRPGLASIASSLLFGPSFQIALGLHCLLLFDASAACMPLMCH